MIDEIEKHLKKNTHTIEHLNKRIVKLVYIYNIMFFLYIQNNYLYQYKNKNQAKSQEILKLHKELTIRQFNQYKPAVHHESAFMSLYNRFCELFHLYHHPKQSIRRNSSLTKTRTDYSYFNTL